jgi:O-antigen ligase
MEIKKTEAIYAQNQYLSIAPQLIRMLYAILLISIPFSISYEIGLHSIECPSELLMIPLSLLLSLNIWQQRKVQKEWLTNPFVGWSIAWLLWMFMGIFPAAYPLVSAKYSLISSLHWLLFAYGLFFLQIAPSKAVEKWFNFYTFPLLLILFYAWYQHAQYGFRMDASVLVARPFYFDHTLLSACLLLLLGVYFSKVLLLYHEIKAKVASKGMLFSLFPTFLFYAILVFLLILGIYLSFSRAAWLSAFLALGFVFYLVLLKKYFKIILTLSLASLLFISIFSFQLFSFIQNNEAQSKQGNWQQQILSSINIKTDVSNLERLNRYQCALRMFADRPIFGFGAGSYPKAYLPYQKAEEMTRISVETEGPHPPGRGGGAHSEYLQALSEMGFIGFLLFLGFPLLSVGQGISVYWKASSKEQRIMALGLLFSLISYFSHGLFNNFLHHDKVAVLFWSILFFMMQLCRTARF